jgi:hypothetical protein
MRRALIVLELVQICVRTQSVGRNGINSPPRRMKCYNGEETLIINSPKRLW